MTKARTNADNASADIQGVTAGTGLSGGGTSGTVTLTNDMATAIDAKGDLVVGTGADAYDNLAVGNNGETLLADSSQSTGLVWSATSGQNFCINGSLDFWQRGTSVSGAAVSPYYGADRWQVYRSAGVTGATFSRQDGTGAGFNYCYRIQRDNGNTATNGLYMAQSFETAQSRNLQGQFLTLSFWARKGANYSASTDAIVKIAGGTGTDQNYANGLTGESTIASINIRSGDLTTSWARYTVTSGAAVANTVTQIAVAAIITPTGTAGAADYVEITGIKLEIGKAATAFTRAGGTLAGELAACQRYYQVVGGSANAFPLLQSQNFVNSPQDSSHSISFPVKMRTAPTATKNGTWSVSNCTQPTVGYISTDGYAIRTVANAQSNWYLVPDSSDDTITFSAEL